MEIKEHVPLAPYTTFGIGGVARFFVQVTSVSELTEAFAFARTHHSKTFILGGGSNVLVPDQGFDGLVIKIEYQGVEVVGEKIVAAAGESWDRIVARAVECGLWGIENLSGIPGTLGGAVVQNIGAYGAALSQTLEWVEVFDAISGTVRTLTKQECMFGYRESVFKHDRALVVLRAALKLSSEPSPNLEYKDLQAAFSGTSPTLALVANCDLVALYGKKEKSKEEEGC
jgi:UDP-N-acetylmuramate dehydrogenase